MIEENQEHEEAAPTAEDSHRDPWGDDQSDEWPDEQLDEQALAEILAEDQLIEDEFLYSDAEDEAEEVMAIATDQPSEPMTESLNGTSEDTSYSLEEHICATREDMKRAIEALLFVADEQLKFKQLCNILGDTPKE